jgi:hypothetical protein
MTACLETVASVKCTQWCSDGSDHHDAEDAAEQGCHGAEHGIQLEAAPEHQGRRTRARVVTQLYRDVYQDDGPEGKTTLEPTHIEVQGTDPETLRLSVSDARTLGRLLLDLADEADQVDGAEVPSTLPQQPRPRKG